jgi:hypothetical protein
MSDEERAFYGALREYLEDGFALAKRQGNKGRALGFVMAIFQKIAASSFAAVHRTLRRRMLMLTLHEAILKDEDLDIDARETLNEEARALIKHEFKLGDDLVSRSEVNRILADLKVKLLRKLNADELAMASDAGSGERIVAGGEDLVATAVNLALPEERLRIKDLLERFPKGRETKIKKLLRGLGALWRQDANEKVVIFATYLGTVELLGREIEAAYPGQGVVVLRGGDHGAKLAAERKFRSKRGPRVMVCTAAGREGINLQFARVLFNFDLPWNPMDIEQRIGRIHRYGQAYTAQVYNLVLSDTIEGKIFLLLNDKLTEIAKALGKVDEHGNIAEDLRSQILGQLSEKIRYDRLYQQALSDPELKRTKVELEAALANASEARTVVFELFQDLEGFSLEDYQPFADVSEGVDRLVRFLRRAVEDQGGHVVGLENDIYELLDRADHVDLRFTTDRDAAIEDDKLDLLGLDHPVFQAALQRWKNTDPGSLGACVTATGDGPAVVTWWAVETHGKSGEKRSHLQSIAVDLEDCRQPALEKRGAEIFMRPHATPDLTLTRRLRLIDDVVEPMLQRDLHHRGVPVDGGYSAELIGWVELV